jgi:hypothetical protein
MQPGNQSTTQKRKPRPYWWAGLAEQLKVLRAILGWASLPDEWNPVSVTVWYASHQRSRSSTTRLRPKLSRRAPSPGTISRIVVAT